MSTKLPNSSSSPPDHVHQSFRYALLQVCPIELILLPYEFLLITCRTGIQHPVRRQNLWIAVCCILKRHNVIPVGIIISEAFKLLTQINLSVFRAVIQPRQAANLIHHPHVLFGDFLLGHGRMENDFTLTVNPLIRAEYADCLSLLHEGDLLLQEVWLPQIVCIKESNILTIASTNAIISGCSRSCVFLLDEMNPLILCLIHTHDIC